MDFGKEIDGIVRQVKEAIQELQSESKGSEAVQIAKVDIELKTFVDIDGGGDFTIKIPFIDKKVGLSGGLSKQETQTITLTLVPEEELKAFGKEDINEALVHALRAIRASLENAAFTTPRFVLDEGSVELNFVVSAEGKVELVLFGQASSDTTHTVRLHLKGSKRG